MALLAEDSMNDVEGRLGTYKKWPSLDTVEPEALANAGFFYTGTVYMGAK